MARTHDTIKAAVAACLRDNSRSRMGRKWDRDFKVQSFDGMPTQLSIATDWWNIELCIISDPTIKETISELRLAGSLDNWIGIFKLRILPIIKEHDLPPHQNRG